MSEELDLNTMPPQQRIERLEVELEVLKKVVNPPKRFSIEVTRIYSDEQEGRPHFILMDEGMTMEECDRIAADMQEEEEKSGTLVRHRYRVV